MNEPETKGVIDPEAQEAFDRLHEAFEERAAIIEFEGGLSRREAEVIARAIVYVPPGGYRSG